VSRKAWAGPDVLLGRRALITGASQGLGREIARAVLAASGDVAICARTAPDIAAAAAELAQEFPQRCIVSMRCDLAKTGDLERFYVASIETLGGLDVVINNAGVHGPIGKLDDIDWGSWTEAIAINLVGTAYSCRLAVEHFKSQPRQSGAKIINLSGGGATLPQTGLSAYGASKAGLVRLTETLAEEVRANGIDVNAVAPGALATRLTREVHQAGPERVGSEYHARVSDLLAKDGMSLACAAELCVYLASRESDGLTGRLISAPWDPWPFTNRARREITDSDIYTLRRIVPKDRGKDWGDC